MAKKHINKNKFKGSLETVFTDIACLENPFFNEDIYENYKERCNSLTPPITLPTEYPTFEEPYEPFYGPIPGKLSKYDENNRPAFSTYGVGLIDIDTRYIWPVILGKTILDDLNLPFPVLPCERWY